MILDSFLDICSITDKVIIKRGLSHLFCVVHIPKIVHDIILNLWIISKGTVILSPQVISSTKYLMKKFPPIDSK